MLASKDKEAMQGSKDLHIIPYFENFSPGISKYWAGQLQSVICTALSHTELQALFLRSELQFHLHLLIFTFSLHF